MHYLEETLCVLIKISLKFVPSPIDNISALVRIMAWHLSGDKPLPEPMMTQYTDWTYCISLACVPLLAHLSIASSVSTLYGVAGSLLTH